ncbi:MAG: DUF721 domain-containing protein [Alphaproteobacteria bacterium]|nr:DUF721 domain-containing protein [Alphaproteobacteria bacterium]
MSPRSLSASLPKITKAILDKGGRDYATLITQWPAIVGAQLAASSEPEKLVRRRDHDERSTGGVLTIRVSSGAALEIQHREPQIIERINSYLGYRGVARLKLVQGVLARRGPARAQPERVLSAPESQAIDSAAGQVADPDLKARLARFGRALATGPNAQHR